MATLKGKTLADYSDDRLLRQGQKVDRLARSVIR